MAGCLRDDGYPGTKDGNGGDGDHVDAFNRYERDEARATELLEDAGYQKDGDQWVDEGGDPIDATITAPAGWSDWVSGAEVAQELLQSFGFQSDLETVDATTYMGDTRPNADFTLGTWAWGGAGEPYPYFSLSYGMSSSDARNISQYPEEVEAPPLGEPDGELETVRPGDLVEELAVAGEGEDEELIQELAWIYNQTLPVLPLIDGMNQGWTNRENWEFPEDDAPELGVNAPYHWLPRVGALQAKTE